MPNDATTASAAAPAGEATPPSAPQDAPTTPAGAAAGQGPAAPPPAADERFIRVPSDHIPTDFGGRWGDVVSAAKQHLQSRSSGLLDDGMADFRQFCREQQLSPAEAMTAIRQAMSGQDDTQSYGRGDQAGMAGPPNPQGAPQAALGNPNDLRRMIQEVLREEREESRRAADTERAWAQEEAAINKALTDAGYRLNEAGEPLDARSEDAKTVLLARLAKGIEGSVPSYLQGDDYERALKAAQNSPAEPQVLAAAMKEWRARMADLGNETIAAFAEGQEDVPGGTLGAGPGGRPPEKSIEDMTETEKEQAVMRRLDEKYQGDQTWKLPMS